MGTVVETLDRNPTSDMDPWEPHPDIWAFRTGIGFLGRVAGGIMV